MLSWTPEEEALFLSIEEDIYKDFQPKTQRGWKGKIPDKTDVMDRLYEPLCVKLLEEYIRIKAS